MHRHNFLRSLPRCLFSAALVAGLTSTAGVFAVDGNPPGLFELDGNTLDSADPGDDWDSIHLGTQAGTPAASTGILADPAPLTIYTQGGSKDINDVTDWRYKDGSVPDKDDITNAYATAYVNPSDVVHNGQVVHAAGDQMIYFGLDRFANSGDAFAVFWFFQDDVGLGPNGSFNGQHVGRNGDERGDLLILVEYPQGSNATPEIKVYEWDPLDADHDNVASNLDQLLSSSDAKCDGSGDKLACAITNIANLPGAPEWPYVNKDGYAGIPLESFFEGGLNVTKLLGGNVPCFSSFLAETRSSRSETAQLKDFVLGDFNLCALEVTKQCTAALDAEGDGVAVDFNGTVTNSGGLALDDVTVTDDKGTPDDSADDVVVFGPVTLQPGESQPYTGSYNTTAIPATDTVTAAGHRNGTAISATAEASCSPDLNPALVVTKQCAANINPDGTGIDVLFNGTVTNTGNAALEDVTVVDDNGTPGVPGDDITVLGPISLAPGASSPYSGGFSASGSNSTDHVSATAKVALTEDVLQANAEASCAADVLPAIEVSKVCTATVNQAGTAVDVLFSGVVTNTGNVTLNDVLVMDDSGTADPADDVSVLGPLVLAPGESAPYNGGFTANDAGSTDNVSVTATDAVSSTPVQANATASCQADVQPAIVVSKVCEANLNPEGTAVDVLFSGTVTNTGNVALGDVMVVDDSGTPGVPGDDVTVLGPLVLGPGESAPYSGGFTANDASSTDNVTASATDVIGDSAVSNSASATCQANVLAAIEVDKVCTASVNPEGSGVDVLFNGTVTNTGNVALGDVMVVDDQGTADLADDITVLGPISLAPGASSPYSGSFVSSNASSTDIVTATGIDVVSDGAVSDTATAACQADVLASIEVDKVCTANVNSGGTGVDVLFNGTVTNTGNVILDGVMVVDDSGTADPADDVTVLGPITLAPGASSPYSGSFSSSSANSTDTVTASGTDVVSFSAVSDSASAACQANVLASIEVDKLCTASINSGGTGIDVLFNGSVTNTGNVALGGVVVVDDSGTADPADDVTVLGPITLAPGASAPYSGSFAASGAGSTDTVIASATDVVSGSAVSDSSSASCQAEVAAAIEVSKICSASVNSGGTGVDVLFSGSVTNTGNVALGNVVVVDDSGTADPADDVTVLGPITLAPGASSPYNGSFSASSASSTDTVTASATDVVSNSAVSDSSSASCQADVAAAIEVSKVCSATVNSGGTGVDVLFNGSVTNTGNVALGNVTVVDDSGTPGVPGDDAIVLGPISLVPGASAAYSGSFSASSAFSTDTVTASGTDVISGSTAQDTAAASCQADVSPAIAVTKQCTDAPAFGEPILFNGTVSNTGNVVLLGVSVVDDNGTPGNPVDDVVFNLGDLAPGASANYNGSYTPALEGPSTNTVVATATDAVQSTPVSSTANATCVVPPPEDFEGCTPGFWKNSVGSWADTPYSPSQRVDSVFTLPSGVLSNQLGDDTLLQALGYPGGTNLLGAAQILLRAAVASILNATHPDVDDFPRTAAEVIADVNAALATKNRATILALASQLDADNNLGCDLPNDNSF